MDWGAIARQIAPERKTAPRVDPYERHPELLDFLATKFIESGWSVKAIARGWKPKGYKGLNLTVVTPDGFHFEIQLHTARSLAAAERTHGIYAEQRDLPFRSPRWRELERIQQEVWITVPMPPGRLELA